MCSAGPPRAAFVAFILVVVASATGDDEADFAARNDANALPASFRGGRMGSCW